MERTQQSLPLVFFQTVLVLVAAKPALAAAPCVQFDVDEIVACQGLDSAEHHHNARMIAARFRVSSIIKFGAEESIGQILFAIESPRQRIHVVDYSPKTQLASEFASNLSIEEMSEKTATAGADLGIKPNEILHASASASTGAKRSATKRYELLAPMQQLASSGTIRRGSGVYFKLKPSSQTSLEGAREFEVIFQVPKDWRGDVVTINCAGFQSSDTRKPVCGSAKFTVGLHLQGDSRAKQTVKELVFAERQLRQLASSRQAAIQKHSFPSLGHRIGAAFSVVDPKIPSRWFDQVLASGAKAGSLSFQRHLPEDVRRAVSRYATARRAADDLASGQPNT